VGHKIQLFMGFHVGPTNSVFPLGSSSLWEETSGNKKTSASPMHFLPSHKTVFKQTFEENPRGPNKIVFSRPVSAKQTTP